jgi:hypothetical protein
MFIGIIQDSKLKQFTLELINLLYSHSKMFFGKNEWKQSTQMNHINQILSKNTNDKQ